MLHQQKKIYHILCLIFFRHHQEVFAFLLSYRHTICYHKGFLSFISYAFYSHKFSISFHISVSRSRGRIISFHRLCVAPDYTLYSLRFGLAFQPSRLIPRFILGNSGFYRVLSCQALYNSVLQILDMRFVSSP